MAIHPSTVKQIFFENAVNKCLHSALPACRSNEPRLCKLWCSQYNASIKLNTLRQCSRVKLFLVAPVHAEKHSCSRCKFSHIAPVHVKSTSSFLVTFSTLRRNASALAVSFLTLLWCTQRSTGHYLWSDQKGKKGPMCTSYCWGRIDIKCSVLM